MFWLHGTDFSPGRVQVRTPSTQGQAGEALLGIFHLGSIQAIDSLDAKQVTLWGISSSRLPKLTLGMKGSYFQLISEGLSATGPSQFAHRILVHGKLDKAVYFMQN